MGLVNTALQIGRSALLSYQSALQVIGNNISNAGSTDYTRQSPGLSSVGGPALPEGMRPGSGVALTSLRRNLDEALENRLRASLGRNQSDLMQQQSMAEVETLFDPLTGIQLSGRITDFFNNMSQVQNAPEDRSARQLAISSASTLAGTLRHMRMSLGELGEGFNDQIAALVESANGISERVANLNGQIVAAESSGAPASALRDQRDALLRDLGELIDVRVQQQPTGAVIVYVGNETLVDGNVSRGLAVTSRLDGEFRRDEVAFADNGSRVAVNGGRLNGLMVARDQSAFARISDVDRLAAALIMEVNTAHGDGQGLEGMTTVTSGYSVTDPTAALNSSEAGLPFEPVNGSFYIATRDETTGALLSYQIQVDLDGIGEETSLESLIAEINDRVAGVSASITPDGRLSMTSDSRMTFTFGFDGQSPRTDTSHLLASLGMNGLFVGTDATNIAVNASVLTDPSRLSAASFNAVGDGSNAGRLAGVGQQASELLDGASIVGFYGFMVNEVAVATAAARENAQAGATVTDSLLAQKENVSGVSLDEEAIELLKFERAFQGASRFVSVVDRLTGELISLVN